MKLTRVVKRLTDALDQPDESLVKLSAEYPDGNPVNDVSYDIETTLWGQDPETVALILEEEQYA